MHAVAKIPRKLKQYYYYCFCDQANGRSITMLPAIKAISPQKTRDYLAWTGYLAYGNRRSEAKGRSRQRKNSRRIATNLYERNVVTRGKCPKQGLTRPTIMFPRGRGSRIIYSIILTISCIV